MFFSEVVGHDGLKDQLRKGVQEGRIAHTQLFRGPRGNGKLSMARAYIQYVLCSNRTDFDSCGTCTSCLGMKKLEHPDVHFSFPIRLEKSKKESHHHIQAWRESVLDEPFMDIDRWVETHSQNKNAVIGVDEVAEINRKVSLRSYAGGYKVVLIWYPERLNPQGANKLLKSIEEPPERTLFILVAENAEALLPTILSRTQQLFVPRLESAQIKQYLSARFEVNAQEAERVSLSCDGDALEATNAFRSEVDDLLPLFRSWMLSCYYRKPEDTRKVCDEFNSLGREGQKRFIRYGAQKVRQCMLMGNGLDQLVTVIDEERNFLGKFSSFINIDTADWFRKECDRMHAQLSQNASGKVLFMDSSYQLYDRLVR